MRYAQLLTAIVMTLLGPAAALASDKGSAEVARIHYRVTDRQGNVHQRTELIFSGDVDGVVTLWQAANGDRFIFRQSDIYAKRLTTFGVADAASKETVYGSFALPYSGATPAEAKANKEKLPPAAYDHIPFTIGTNGYHGSAPIERWHEQEAAERTDLHRHLSPSFMRRMRENATLASAAGSPAARIVCEFLVDAAVNGAVCAHDRGLSSVPTPADCDFDAQFGFPCRP